MPSELDDFAALKCDDYRACYGTLDLGPFITDPVIRFGFRRLLLPVYGSSGIEEYLEGRTAQQAEIELSLRDAFRVLENLPAADSASTFLKFTPLNPDSTVLNFPRVHPVPKISFVPSAHFGHRAVLTFYAKPDASGALLTAE